MSVYWTSPILLQPPLQPKSTLKRSAVCAWQENLKSTRIREIFNHSLSKFNHLRNLHNIALIYHITHVSSIFPKSHLVETVNIYTYTTCGQVLLLFTSACVCECAHTHTRERQNLCLLLFLDRGHIHRYG